MQRNIVPALLLGAALAACGGGGSTGSVAAAIVAGATPTPSPTPTSSSVTTSSSAIDPTRIPIGDGKVSTTPAIGYVDSCQTTFGGGGASSNGPWIHSDGTWDSTTKLAVQGSVPWSSSLSVTVNGTTRHIATNDLPNHTTGIFPIASTDPAYAYDRNPNSIVTQSLAYDVPANPTAAATPTCTGLGPIGIMLTGAAIFNALDAAGHDAGAHEVQDSCQGHPQQSGLYHYHALTVCIADPGSGHSTLLGYARDGFGIYGNRGEQGQSLTNADLDVCHGHTHAIAWDGQTVTMYHYHATREYPYTVGCYRGTPQ